MSKPNINNELIKRKYFKYLKQAEGFSESTIDCFNKAIILYEEFTSYEDFTKKFCPDRMIEYKNWLKRRKFKGNNITLTTFHSYLRNLRRFFLWLSTQSGYKSRINAETIGYLRLQMKEDRITSQFVPREYPSIEHIIRLCRSIIITNEIDLRDRALIAFAALTGMRDTAIATLPISCFDDKRLIVYQDPKKGVKTKFSKYIQSNVYRIDEELVQFILDWLVVLRQKGFLSSSPLFPRSKVNQDGLNISFEKATTVEPEFWTGAGQIRKIFKKRSHDAGLDYYPPHSFRHFTANFTIGRCKNGEEMRAVSQSFGHENLNTTIGSYGHYPPNRLNEILGKIDFSKEPNENDELIRKLIDLVKQ